MSSPALPLTDCERAALLRIETAYEQWRIAQAAQASSELHLWTEALAGADAQACRRLGADTVKLRDASRAARLALLALLRQRPGTAAG